MTATHTVLKDSPSIHIEKVVLTGGTNSDPIHCLGARSVVILGTQATTELIAFVPDDTTGLPTTASKQLDAALGINSPTDTKAGMIGRWDMPPWFGIDGDGTFYVMITWEQAGA